MAGAMVWTLIADVIPVSERTAVFNQVNAFMLILNVLINPISALLLKYDPWFAMFAGFAFLIAGTFSALLIPETLGLRLKADDGRRHDQQSIESGRIERDEDYDRQPLKHGIVKQIWFTIRNDMGHVWRFIFASKSIMVLIVSFAVFYPVRLAYSGILLQYMTKRFNWEWSTVRFLRVPPCFDLPNCQCRPPSSLQLELLPLLYVYSLCSLAHPHCYLERQARDLS